MGKDALDQERFVYSGLRKNVLRTLDLPSRGGVNYRLVVNWESRVREGETKKNVFHWTEKRSHIGEGFQRELKKESRTAGIPGGGSQTKTEGKGEEKQVGQKWSLIIARSNP